MKTLRHPALSSIILALALLPSVYGYDCSILTTTKCSPAYSGPRQSYPECLVSQLSASAFIQCASQKNSDDLVYEDDGDTQNIAPLDVLTQAISIPECDNCPLRDKIKGVAMNSNRGPDGTPPDFGKNLCRANPADVGMCCLKKCLGGSPEHSIQAFCSEEDIMQAPLLPDDCISNGASNDDSSSSDTGSDDTSSVASDLATSQTTSSTVPTASIAANDNARPLSTSNAASTPQATPSSGAALGRQHILMDLARKLGVAILPLAVAFRGAALAICCGQCQAWNLGLSLETGRHSSSMRSH